MTPDPTTLDPGTLGPDTVRTRRSQRYRGDGMEIPMEELAPADREGVRKVYQALRRPYLRWLETRPDVDRDGIWSMLQTLAEPELARATTTLGEASRELAPSEERSRALHDIRGGALTALSLELMLAEEAPGAEGLRSLVFLARDHAKIMRNALVDLDPEARADDEAEKAHGIADIVEKWHGAEYRLEDRAARVSVHAEYEGGVSSCCLEISALDRVLYNLVNNATRFTADRAVELTILPWPEDSVRFLVTNAVTDDQAAWIQERTGRPSELFLAGLTRGGQGLGLANCASFVAAAYGHPRPDEAVEEGLVGAELLDERFAAWFHWPAYG